MKKWIFATLLFALVVTEMVFFAPGRGDRVFKGEIEPPVTAPGQEEVEQELSGGYLVEATGDKKNWELWSEVAKKKRDSDEWRLEQVRVRFYGQNKVSYVAEGDEGVVRNDQAELTIRGNVVVRSSNGYLLQTEEIFYNNETRLIEGPDKVKLRGPDEVGDKGPLHLTGDKFEASMSTNIITVLGNVRGKKKMSHDRNMKISSHKATFSGQSKLAKFEKDVIIDVESMRITGPRAKFMYADGKLHSLFIDGGVRITDVGKWGVAGQAEVFFREDKYVFRGSPKVVQGEDELVGDIITIYEGGKKVQVVKAKAKYLTKEQEQEQEEENVN